MYVELAQIKKHLNINSEFTEDDDYLLTLADVAEKAVEKHINQRLSSVCEENGGVLPSPLLHAILLFIGNLYLSRESISYSSVTEVPMSYNYLLDLYKNYNNENLDV